MCANTEIFVILIKVYTKLILIKIRCNRSNDKTDKTRSTIYFNANCNEKATDEMNKCNCGILIISNLSIKIDACVNKLIWNKYFRYYFLKKK